MGLLGMIWLDGVPRFRQFVNHVVQLADRELVRVSIQFARSAHVLAKLGPLQ